MTPTQIERRYRARAVALMKTLAKAFEVESLNLEDGRYTPTDLDSYKVEELRISFSIGREGDLIDISFGFYFSENWDGEKGGVNFGVDIVHEDGRMIGGLTPYNFTERVWAPRRDPEAVEERFRILEDADAWDAISTVKNWLDRK